MKNRKEKERNNSWDRILTQCIGILVNSTTTGPGHKQKVGFNSQLWHELFFSPHILSYLSNHLMSAK